MNDKPLKILTLKRTHMRPDAVFGIFDDEGEPFALTVERPWLSNQTGISCIPSGEYTCLRVKSPKFGNTFQVMNVPNRTEILIHRGNISDDSHGCIIIGEQFGHLDGKTAVLSSNAAFEEFLLRLLGEEQFKLVVTEVRSV